MVLYSLIEGSVFLVILVQIFEWIAMCYMIETQKDRSVNEIIMDYQSEDINAPMNASIKSEDDDTVSDS